MSETNITSAELKNMLKEVYCITGLNFSEYSFSYLKRRTEVFLENNSIKSDTDFIYKVNKSAGFAGQYIEHIYVENSELFRDAEMWNFIETKILPKYSPKHTIKIWFPYSKDSKELYSLLYILGNKDTIFNVDLYVTAVTEKRLSEIKKGLFHSSDLKSSAKNIEILNSAVDADDVFISENGAYKVKNNFKGTVSYDHAEFISDEYISEFDMIFCRNAFIYFNEELQVKAEKLINRALKKGGYLFIGFCENLISENSKYKQLSKDFSIYKKKTLS